MMRVTLGVLSLLMVFAVVALSAKKPVQALVEPVGVDRSPTVSASAPLGSPPLAAEQRVKDGVERGMRQGVERDAEAVP